MANSKDPAFLFYSSDFISGTFTMSDAQRGQYIMLLCLQHQKGYLTERDMLKICNTYDEDIWCKFEQEGDKFYNIRLKEESERRARYSESRANNRKKKHKKTSDKDKNNTSKTYDKHMETVTETETETDNSIEKVKNEIKDLCKKKDVKPSEVFSHFEKWRDYLFQQHEVLLKENQYTYEVLENALSEHGDMLFEAIDFSIKSTYKKIYLPPPKKTTHKRDNIDGYTMEEIKKNPDLLWEDELKKQQELDRQWELERQKKLEGIKQ